MKKNKVRIILVLCLAFLIYDIVHFLVVRNNYEELKILGYPFESSLTSSLKWILIALMAMGLFLYHKNKNWIYITLFSSIGAIILAFANGPLFNIYRPYSEISFWILLIIGIISVITSVGIIRTTSVSN